MSTTRESISSIYQDIWACINSGDWDQWLEYFSSNCRFTNSAMQEVIEGKNNLRELAKTFPPVINTPEWFAIDGHRLVVSWQERPKGAPEDVAYRGVSSFYFDREGKVSDYVGTFNMQEVARAFAR